MTKYRFIPDEMLEKVLALSAIDEEMELRLQILEEMLQEMSDFDEEEL